LDISHFEYSSEKFGRETEASIMADDDNFFASPKSKYETAAQQIQKEALMLMGDYAPPQR
jgi:hypothetical protein